MLTKADGNAAETKHRNRQTETDTSGATTMNMTTDRNDQPRNKGSFFGEWMLHLALVVAVVGALVERGIAMSGGMIV
jgi:hypothetical protein